MKMRFLFEQPVCQHQTSGFYSILGSQVVSPTPVNTPVKRPQYSHQSGKGEEGGKKKKTGA